MPGTVSKKVSFAEHPASKDSNRIMFDFNWVDII